MLDALGIILASSSVDSADSNSSAGLFGLLWGGALLLGGYKLFSKGTPPRLSNQALMQNIQQLPHGSDFVPTHIHANIALDANTSRVWLRDASGITKIFYLSEIVRWTWQGDFRFLSVETNDLDKPIWKVPFNGSETQLKEWSARLSAAYRR